MQFGERIFGNDARDMIASFGDSGYTMLDTAYVYNDGESERLIGSALSELKQKYSIATKVNPRITGKLDKVAVVSQLNESLERLRLPSVDILYLHFPDPNTSVESALEGCAELFDQGKFLELGLSNFPAWLVAEAHNVCERNGWMLPTVYEGLYNPLSRHAERELDLCLSYYKMRFYAYNPLAGGLMTDKYKDRIISDGRFKNRPNYQKRYWHDSYFAAIDAIRSVCEPHGISIAEAAYRWLAYHSMLKAQHGDGIIIGASSIPQFIGNIEAVQKGMLPDDVVTAINNAWEISRADAPEYFTFYKPKG